MALPTEAAKTNQGIDVSALLDAHARDRPFDPALTVDDQTWTFEELHTLALQAANRLASLGTQAGQIVALPMFNSIEQTAFLFGAWRLGATPMPLAPTAPEPELRAIMEVAGTSIVVREGQALENEPLWHGESRLTPRMKAQASGGSTGAPKVVVDTHPSAINVSAAEKWGWMLGDTMLVLGPTFHAGPLNHLAEGIARGRHVILMRKFEAAKALRLISKHRPHFALLVPTMMHRIVRLPTEILASADFSSLKRVWHSAAACPKWLKERWIELVGSEALWEIYGSSEGIGATIISGTEWLAHPGSVGRVQAGEMAIFDEQCRRVPNGTVGEIYMRDSNSPRRFEFAGSVKRRTHEDWESAGDMGWIDDDGYLYLADRRLDMINTGGQNVYPAEVEASILTFPCVTDVAVFGQPDEDLGEIVCAQVCIEGNDVTQERLLEHLSGQIARYKIPRRITFTTEPIRNEAGKVRKANLRLSAQA